MALESNRADQVNGILGALRTAAERLTAQLGASGALSGWLRRQAFIKFFSSSLLRRILVTNLIGLAIVIGGIQYSSQHHAWLIEAKVESLQTQGQMIAAAIAGDARVETDRLLLDFDKLPEADGSRAPFRDDAFSALQLSLKPEKVTRILRRLIQPARIRARIYDRDGTLIIDSATLLSRGQIAKYDPKAVKEGERPDTKDFWTRLKSWLIDKNLPVYKEIGTAKGTAYPQVRMAMTGTPTPMLLLNERGEQIVSVAVPIRRTSVVEGVLLISSRPGEIDKILWGERLVIWTLAAIALLATVVTSYMLARTVAEPMRRLSAAARNVTRNINARQDLPEYVDRNDEVGQMASAFGAMTAALFRRIEASENFALDVAHELKNPLTAARSTAESLAYARTEEQRVQLVHQIQTELKRLNRLITDVSNASRLDAELARQTMRPVDVTQVLHGVTGIFRDILTDDTRRVVLDIAPAPFEGAFMVNGDDGRLGQVMTNLVDNAVSFSPPGGTVRVHARRDGTMIELMVDDEGPGVPDDRLEVIFDRFYTDRPATEEMRGKNSGLGLSISREIVRAHGGQITAENLRGPDDGGSGEPRGARFIVRLPAARAAPRGGPTSGRRA